MQPLRLPVRAPRRDAALRATFTDRAACVADAAAVRALADSVRKSDPGFASDLYAAADRHERERDADGRAPTAR